MSIVHDAETVVRPSAAPPVEIPAPRSGDADTTPPATPATPAAPVDPCRCGHGRDAHEHYRPGTDCGTCGTSCRAFRAADRRIRRRSRRS